MVFSPLFLMTFLQFSHLLGMKSMSFSLISLKIMAFRRS